MFHFPEGAIDDASVQGHKSLIIIAKEVAGFAVPILLSSDAAEAPVSDLVDERLRASELSVRGYRNATRDLVEVGGVPGESYGWEFVDDEKGFLGAHQVIATHAGRAVALSATFPVAIRSQVQAALVTLAAAIRWRPS